MLYQYPEHGLRVQRLGSLWTCWNVSADAGGLPNELLGQLRNHRWDRQPTNGRNSVLRGVQLIRFHWW